METILTIDTQLLMDSLVIGILLVLFILSLIATSFLGTWAWSLNMKNRRLKALVHILHRDYDQLLDEFAELSNVLDLKNKISKLESDDKVSEKIDKLMNHGQENQSNKENQENN